MVIYDARIFAPLAVRYSQARLRPEFQDGHLVEDSLAQIHAVPIARLADYVPEDSRIDDIELTEYLLSVKEEFDYVLLCPFPPIEIVRFQPLLRGEFADAEAEDKIAQRGGAQAVAQREVYGEEQWFSFDNRRLYCLQRKAVQLYPARVGCIVESFRSIQGGLASQIRKFKTSSEGRTVSVGHRFNEALDLWEWRRVRDLGVAEPSADARLQAWLARLENQRYEDLLSAEILEDLKVSGVHQGAGSDLDQRTMIRAGSPEWSRLETAENVRALLGLGAQQASPSVSPSPSPPPEEYWADDRGAAKGAEHGYFEQLFPERAAPQQGGHYEAKGYAGYAAAGKRAKGYAEKGYVEKGYAEKGYAEKGYAEKGYVEKGHAEKGYAEKGYVEKGYVEKGYYGKGYGKGYDAYEKGFAYDKGAPGYSGGKRGYDAGKGAANGYADRGNGYGRGAARGAQEHGGASGRAPRSGRQPEVHGPPPGFGQRPEQAAVPAAQPPAKHGAWDGAWDGGWVPSAPSRQPPARPQKGGEADLGRQQGAQILAMLKK